jgi:hypothetical protein
MQGYLASGAYSPTAMLYIALLCCRSERLCHPVSRPDQRLRTASPSRVDTAHLTTVSSNPWVPARTCKCKTLKQGRIRSRQDRLYTQHVYLAVRVIGLRLPVIRAHELLHTHAYSSHDWAAISQSLTIFHLHISCSPGQWQSPLRPP